VTRCSPPRETGLSHWSSRELSGFLKRTENISVSHNYIATLWRGKQSGGAPCGSCCLGWHPGVGGQGVADGVDGSASVVAGADEVGPDPAMALQGGQGAPAPLDLGGEFEPADRRLRPVVGGWDVESGGEQPHLLGFALEPFGQLQAGMVALVPGPGQVRGDPDGHAVVVAAPQPGDQVGVGGGLVVGAGGVDLVDRRA